MRPLHAPQSGRRRKLAPPLQKIFPVCSPSRPTRHHSGKPKGPRLRAFRVIGETGFEPATARPPAGCATRLRHSPWSAESTTVPSDAHANMCSCQMVAKTRKCYRCGERKPADAFAWRRRERSASATPSAGRVVRRTAESITSRTAQRYIEQARRAEAAARARADRRISSSTSSTHPCRRLWRDRSSGPRVRPPAGQAVRHRAALPCRNGRPSSPRSRSARWSAPTATGDARHDVEAHSARCSTQATDRRSGRRESNRRFELGRLTCSRYTTPARALDDSPVARCER